MDSTTPDLTTRNAIIYSGCATVMEAALFALIGLGIFSSEALPVVLLFGIPMMIFGLLFISLPERIMAYAGLVLHVCLALLFSFLTALLWTGKADPIGKCIVVFAVISGFISVVLAYAIFDSARKSQ